MKVLMQYGMFLPYGIEDIEKLGVHVEGAITLDNGWLFLPIEKITRKHVDTLYNAGIRNHEYRRLECIEQEIGK